MVTPTATLTADKTNEKEEEEKLREKAALEKFEAQMKPIAQSLANASHGPKMLKQIGFVYEKQAEQVLTDPVAGFGTWADLGVRSNFAAMEQNTNRTKTQFSAMKAAFGAFGTVKKIAEEETTTDRGRNNAATRAASKRRHAAHFRSTLERFCARH
jgi:hypothetical protein